MAGKKSDLDSLLSNQAAKPQIQRGQGMRLSTEAPAGAETQARSSAEAQQGESAETQKRRNAETQRGPKRVNRGYMLREDLIKACKRLAVEEDRNLYEIMEEALEQYLERRRES